jgi:arginyl-tRNA synthetase
MDPFALFAGHVRDIVAALVRSGALKGAPDTSKIVVEPPRDADHGDLATNAAMVLAKDSGIKPRDLSVMIA